MPSNFDRLTAAVAEKATRLERLKRISKPVLGSSRAWAASLPQLAFFGYFQEKAYLALKQAAKLQLHCPSQAQRLVEEALFFKVQSLECQILAYLEAQRLTYSPSYVETLAKKHPEIIT